jgi:hypothetical protein
MKRRNGICGLIVLLVLIYVCVLLALFLWWLLH